MQPHFSAPQLFLALMVLALLVSQAFTAVAADIPSTPEAESLLAQVRPELQRQLQRKGLSLGQPIFVRIFKIPGTLEVWVEKNHRFQLFKTYRICTYSGFLGPKTREGDKQAPEGFYSVTPDQLNPKSSYHLSFNIGYPNEYDAARYRGGKYIMVHGDCQSSGCFAMTDNRIEEIYLLAHAAFSQGQEQFGVHIFPFHLTPRNLEKYWASPWIKFWENLQPGYMAFEQLRQVPMIAVQKGKYVVSSRGSHLALQHLK
nr:murein L,D-transpeptidase family protein [uncultured Desulfobulbus sp.]